MAAKKLTPLSVQNAKPRRNSRTEIPDRGNPGLFLIVQPSGVKSWALRYRNAKGRSRKLTLGPVAGPGGLTLAAAHLAASKAKLEIEQGADPAAAKSEARAASKQMAALQADDGIEAAIERFMTLHARQKTREVTWKAYDSIFRRLVIPAWRGRTLHEIKRRDVIALVEGIAVENGPYMANRLLGVLSKFFNWAVNRDLIDTSPATGVERPHVEIARDRVLDDSEVAILWKACIKLGPAGDYVRLLLLLGCRRNELGAARWDEIDQEKRTLTIPAARSKNKHVHVIPLVDAPWDIVTAQKRTGPFLFPAKWGGGPLAAFHHLKDRVDEHAKLKPWRYHDLRRTCASGMQKLGIPVEVIESCLGHSSGTFRGIVSTYQRHDYSAERRVALQKWADHIAQLTGGKSGKIVAFPRGKRR